MKKYSALLLFIVLAHFCNAQRKKEFQVRAGLGLGIYGSKTEFTYELPGNNLTDKDEGGAVTFHFPIELRYEITKRFNLGLDTKFGSYLYDPDSAEGKSNNFFAIGAGAEYSIVNKENFRWYGGIGFNYSSLTLVETSDNFSGTSEKNESKYSGSGFKLNTGVLVFLSKHFGLNFNFGYDSHNFTLQELKKNGQTQDLSNFKGKLWVKGGELNAGLCVRF